MEKSEFVQLKEIITASGLVENEKQLWYQFIHAAGVTDVKVILKAFKKDAGYLTFFTKNLLGKINALKRGDSTAWDTVIQEEVDFLRFLEELE